MTRPSEASPSRRPYFWIGNQAPGGDLGPGQPMIVISLWPLLYERPDLRVMSEQFAKDILAKQPEGPYLLGGFCYSGLVAYEVARRLVAGGHEVQLLTVVHPSRLGPVPIRRWLRLVRRVVLSVRHPSTLVRYVTQQFPRSGQSRRAPSPEQRLSVLVNDYRSRFDELSEKSVASYMPRRYDGRVTFIVGDRTPNGIFCRMVYGPLVRGGMDIHRIPGADWKELYTGPALAKKIRACIDDSLASPLEGLTPSGGRVRARH